MTFVCSESNDLSIPAIQFVMNASLIKLEYLKHSLQSTTIYVHGTQNQIKQHSKLIKPNSNEFRSSIKHNRLYRIMIILKIAKKAQSILINQSLKNVNSTMESNCLNQKRTHKFVNYLQKDTTVGNIKRLCLDNKDND